MRLLDTLTAANKSAEKGEDELIAAHFALMSVMSFLAEDPDIRARISMRSLAKLAAAIGDVVAGTKPALIFDRPQVINTGGSRKADTSFEAAEGMIAAALQILFESGEKLTTAASIVASELRRAGVRSPPNEKYPNGQSLEAKQVRYFREKLTTTASERAKLAYETLLQKHRLHVKRSALSNRQAARESVMAAAFGIKAFGF